MSNRRISNVGLAIRKAVVFNPSKYYQSELAQELNISRQSVDYHISRLKLRDFLRRKQWSFYCPECGKRISPNQELCGECRAKQYRAKRVTLTCHTCGKEFERKESEVRSELQFCSNRCNGVYAGNNYGWGRKKLVGV